MINTIYIKDLVAFLNSNYPQPNALWNYSEDNALPDDWLIVTPKDVWGKLYQEFKMALAGSDPDFGLQPCSSGGMPGTRCVPIQATVKAPGQPPTQFIEGHSYILYEELYKALISAEKFIDFVTLTPPTGRFLAAFRNAITFISNKEQSKRPVIRILYSNPSTPLIAGDFLHDITRDVDKTRAMEIYAGIMSSSFLSWNHSKIAAIDGIRCIVGGHNMWGPDYLDANPVFDLSMKSAGTSTVHAHDFADRLWDFMFWRKQHILQWILPSDPADDIKLHAAYRYNQSSGQNELKEGVYPPQDIYKNARKNFSVPQTGSHVPVLAIGRSANMDSSYLYPSLYSYLFPHTEPADDTMVNLVSLAKTNIRMSVQAFQTAPYFADWKKPLFMEFGKAVQRGVDIYIVISNPGIVVSGTTAIPVPYSGEVPGKVNEKLLTVMKTDLNIAEADAKKMINDHFNPASLRYSADETYPGNALIPNHAKTFMVDDAVFYIGSQNQYDCNLNELGYVVEDAAKAQEYLERYWNPMWEQSKRTVVKSYSTELDEQESTEAMEFILNLKKNRRLADTWQTTLEQRQYETAPEDIANTDKMLADIVINAGFVTTVDKILETLAAPFFTEQRADNLPNGESDRFVADMMTDEDLLLAFSDVIDEPVDSNEEADANLNIFLQSKGYHCSSSQVAASFDQLRNHMLEYWTGEYETWIKDDGGESFTSANYSYADSQSRAQAPAVPADDPGAEQVVPGPLLIVAGNTNILLDGVVVNDPVYENGILTWSSAQDNATSGSVQFGEITRPGLNDIYVGNEFYGTIIYPGTGTAPQKGKVSFYGRMTAQSVSPADSDVEHRFNYLKFFSYISAGILILLAGAIGGIFLKKRFENERTKRDNAKKDDDYMMELIDKKSSGECRLDKQLAGEVINPGEHAEKTSEVINRKTKFNQNDNNQTSLSGKDSWANKLDTWQSIREPGYDNLVKEHLDDMADVSSELPWEYCQQEIDSHVNNYITSELQAIDDPFAKDTDTLVQELYSYDLQKGTREVLDNFIIGNLDETLGGLDAKTTHTLYETQIVQPRFREMLLPGSGSSSSYLEDCTRSVILKQNEHYLSENASEIQKQITESAESIEQTSAEIADKQAALSGIEEELSKKPDDPDLNKQKEALEKEINDLVEQEKKAESAKEEAEKDQDKNNRDAEENTRDMEETNREKAEKGETVFKTAVIAGV